MFSREFFYQLEDELTRALHDQNRKDYQVSKERLEEAGFIRVIDNNGHRITVGRTTETKIMTTPIDRIRAKALQARSIAPTLIKEFESDLDSLIAEGPKLEADKNAAVSQHKEAFSGLRGEFDGLRSVIDVLSNGGPPLAESENSGQG